jgi:Uncharacterized protein conserved in bacteria (DUF2252)
MRGQKGGAAKELGDDALALDAPTSPSWPRLTTWDPSISVEERKACGKEARCKAPRSSHAIFRSSPPVRRDPVDLLEEQTANGVPELVAIRYGRMLVSPFAYFRGSSLAMTSDLAATATSELTAQICGDAQLSNFGVFMSAESRLFFDISDFDETTPGPWEWDVKRLAASIEVFGRDYCFGGEARTEIVRSTVRSYREAMRDFAQKSLLDVWHAHLGVEQLLPRFHGLLDSDRTPGIWHDLSKARAHDSHQPLDHLTEVGLEGGPRISGDPPSVTLVDDADSGLDANDELGWIQGIIRSYVTTIQPELRHLLEDYRIDHLARKVVGIANAGRDTWIVLMTDHVRGAPLLLQVTQAEVSVAERFLPKGAFSNHGQRVVYGQRLIQGDDDIFLGWERDSREGVNRDYYVRQLRDWRVSADIAGMTPAGMELWGRMCGWTLARAHARSGDRIAIASYLGKSTAFDRAIVRYAGASADQNERDFAVMQKAVRKGRLAVESPT